MSTFRRRLLMMTAASKNGLPAGWKETEYVFTNIKQKEYFDTGILPTQNTKVEIKVRLKDYPAFGAFGIFGARDNNSKFVFSTFNNRFRAEYGSNILDLGVTISTNKTYVAVKDGPDNYLDGTKLTSNPASEISTPYTLCLCGINEAGSMVYITGNYIYYCKIWQASEPVRDFIPVSDGTREALYDLVTETLFYKLAGPKTLETENEAEGGVE